MTQQLGLEAITSEPIIDFGTVHLQAVGKCNVSIKGDQRFVVEFLRMGMKAMETVCPPSDDAPRKGILVLVADGVPAARLSQNQTDLQDSRPGHLHH